MAAWAKIVVAGALLTCSAAKAADGDAALQDLARAYLDAASKADRAAAARRIKARPDLTPEALIDALRSCREYPSARPGCEEVELTGRDGRRISTYTLITPQGYDPARAWPLILALAGGRGDGAAYARFWLRALGGKTYFVVCPTARDYWWRHSYIIARLALKEVFKRFHIDRNRVYVTGISNGGSGTWFMAMRYPDLFAAAAPMAGAPQTGPRRVDYPFLLNLLHVPVYIVHGGADKTIRPRWDEKAAELLKDAGYEHRLEIIPQGSHGSPQQRVPQILEWFAEKRRDPSPPRIRFLKQSSGAKGCYWTLLGKTSSPASIDIRVADPHTIEIKSARLRQAVVFLNAKLVDLSQPIHVRLNGEPLGRFTPKPSVDAVLASVVVFDDPERLYPVMQPLRLEK